MQQSRLGSYRATSPANALPRLVSYDRCACGRCRECIENARWDRIFAEKFASKEPESRGLSRSPLTDL